jgi:hypothetical protein
MRVLPAAVNPLGIAVPRCRSVRFLWVNRPGIHGGSAIRPVSAFDRERLADPPGHAEVAEPRLELGDDAVLVDPEYSETGWPSLRSRR